jgi:hypothetical protein
MRGPYQRKAIGGKDEGGLASLDLMIAETASVVPGNRVHETIIGGRPDF